MALYDFRQYNSQSLRYGQDPGVTCLSTLARALWALGYPDQALQRSQEALALARQLAHPFSLAFALYFGAVVCQYRRDWQGVQRLAEALMALSAEQGFAQRLAQARIMLGWTLVEQGQVAEGMVQIRQSMAAYGATGADLGRSSYLVLLAEAYGKEGQVEEGSAVLSNAMTAVHRNRICFNEAEIYRLKGELLLLQAMGESDAPARPPTEAEACLHQALDVARRQGAKSLELRAAMSLGRLWQQQGKRREARLLLADIYNWFTEGFETADLQEAKELLEWAGMIAPLGSHLWPRPPDPSASEGNSKVGAAPGISLLEHRLGFCDASAAEVIPQEWKLPWCPALEDVRMERYSWPVESVIVGRAIG